MQTYNGLQRTRRHILSMVFPATQLAWVRAAPLKPSVMRYVSIPLMKFIFTVVLSAFTLGSIRAQDPSSSPTPVDAVPRFAEYGNLRFSDEKALLDHLASSFKRAPDPVIYFLIYSDWQSCQRQGKARAVRAKNYLVKHHGIEADTVVWNDGGFESELSVEVWLLGRNEARPEPFPVLDQLKANQMRKRRCHMGRG